jgi:hypothetical protein
MGRIAGRFARVEPRRRVRQFVAGLLAELPRTNCWTIGGACRGGHLARALDAGVPARWVTADEVCGADPQLRGDLERRRVGYVLAVARDYRVPTAAGPSRPRRTPRSPPPAPALRVPCGFSFTAVDRQAL